MFPFYQNSIPVGIVELFCATILATALSHHAHAAPILPIYWQQDTLGPAGGIPQASLHTVYRPTAGFSSTTAAPPPSTSSSSAACECGPCGCCEGCFFSSRNSSCISCEAGSFAPNCKNRFVCEACPPGYSCPYPQMITPLKCPEGTYSMGSSIECSLCSSARTSDYEGYECTELSVFLEYPLYSYSLTAVLGLFYLVNAFSIRKYVKTRTLRKEQPGKTDRVLLFGLSGAFTRIAAR
jgi:hypothetical protein